MTLRYCRSTRSDSIVRFILPRAVKLEAMGFWLRSGRSSRLDIGGEVVG